MKDLGYYMGLRYKMEITPDLEEGGYVISYPDLPGCLTCVDSLDEIAEYAEDCRKTWLEGMLADGADIPEPSEAGMYSGQFKLRLPKSLHKALAIKAKEEGVSMNQYCVYLLSARQEMRHPE